MKTHYLFGIVTLGLSLGVPTLHAQEYAASDVYLPPGAGLYVRAGIGPAFFEDGQIRQFGSSSGNRIDYRPGISSDVAIGFAFNEYLAADVELGYVGTRIRSISGFSTDNTTVENWPFMANLRLTIPIPNSLVTPYLGVGAGGSYSALDTDRISDNNFEVFGRQDDTVFAWQAFAGLEFHLTHRISLGLGYKYFATQNPEYSYRFDGPGNGRFNVGFDGPRTHSVLATFMYKF